jgi:N-acetylglucosamine kinase-like BadF-type ATPase
LKGWLLGIDAGGSGTQALLAAPGSDGRVTLQTGPCNWTTLPATQCRTAIEEIARAAGRTREGGSIVSVCLCSAGYYPPRHAGPARDLLGVLWPGARIRVETDLAAAWAGALGGEPGVVLIAGTGSVAYARAPRKRPAPIQSARRAPEGGGRCSATRAAATGSPAALSPPWPLPSMAGRR